MPHIEITVQIGSDHTLSISLPLSELRVAELPDSPNPRRGVCFRDLRGASPVSHVFKDAAAFLEAMHTACSFDTRNTTRPHLKALP